MTEIVLSAILYLEMKIVSNHTSWALFNLIVLFKLSISN